MFKAAFFSAILYSLVLLGSAEAAAVIEKNPQYKDAQLLRDQISAKRK